MGNSISSCRMTRGGRSRGCKTRQFLTYTVKPWTFLWMLGIPESSRSQGKMGLVSPGMDTLSSNCTNRAFGRKKGLGVTFSSDISGLVLSWVDHLGKTLQVCHLFLIDYLQIIKFLIYWVQALPMMLELALTSINGYEGPAQLDLIEGEDRCYLRLL